MSEAPEFHPPNLKPRAPSSALPPGACDCHFHVFGPQVRYPYIAARTYTPAPAPIADYLAVCDQIGLARGVLVQASIYGLDNTSMLDALAAFPDRLRGVAVIGPETTSADLAELHVAGVRAIRINPRFPGGLDLAQAQALAPLLAELGWHIQVIGDAEFLAHARANLGDLPVPLVLDHMGHAPQVFDGGSQAFEDLRALVAGGNTWVKLSAPYLLSRDRPLHRSTLGLQRTLIAEAPERMLWGSNWPHPGLSLPMPEEGDLLDLLAAAVGSPQQIKQILVDNPAALYGFAPVAEGARP